MSHHNTREIQQQVVERLADMFKTIVADEASDLDPAIGDTAAFSHMSSDGELAVFTFTQDENIVCPLELNEEQVTGFLEGDEDVLEEIDEVVYGIVCDFEDSILEGDDLTV